MNKKLRIEDVASACGVSRATVDRVLNGRGSVHPSTVARVQAAIRDLGYSPSALAARRPGAAKRIGVLLSSGSSAFFAELRRTFEAVAAKDENESCDFVFGDFDPYRPDSVVAALRAVDHDINSLIMVGVDAPEVAAEIDAIAARGVRVVTAVSDVGNSMREVFVGQDNFAAGRTAGRLMADMIPQGPGVVVALIGHLQFRHLLDRQSGLTQTLALMRPDLTVYTTRPYCGDSEAAREVIDDIIARTPKLRGAYLAGGVQPSIIDALCGVNEHRIVAIGHEVTDVSRSALVAGCLKAIIAHDLDEVARKAISAARNGAEDSDAICGVNIFVQDNLPRRVC
ncbi:MAG: LacI family DNA-binding transcriptional regulator [Pseudomonadota bacterium]